MDIQIKPVWGYSYIMDIWNAAREYLKKMNKTVKPDKVNVKNREKK